MTHVPREMWIATMVCIALSFVLGGFVWLLQELIHWAASW